MSHPCDNQILIIHKKPMKPYIQPKTNYHTYTAVGIMQAASPVLLIQGVHNPIEWQRGGASADDAV